LRENELKKKRRKKPVKLNLVRSIESNNDGKMERLEGKEGKRERNGGRGEMDRKRKREGRKRRISRSNDDSVRARP